MSNAVNLGDKYTHRITLRVNDSQMDFLIRISKLLDITPSDYLRMTINSSSVALAGKLSLVENGMVGMENENVEANRNNIV